MYPQILFVFLLVFFSCTSPYGKRVEINKEIEIFIKNGATEEEARKLGTYIDTSWTSSNNKISFLLSKDSGFYTVRMVVDENKIKADSTLDGSFRAMQYLIEEQVFKGNKVKLILTDDRFNDIKIYYGTPSPYGKRVEINNDIEIFIKNGATEKEAKKLGRYIDTSWESSNNKKSFQLSKDSGYYTVRMVVDENAIKTDSTLDGSFRAIQFLIEEQVFKGNTVKLILTDNTFKDIKIYYGTPLSEN